jgi:hypothetical protein
MDTVYWLGVFPWFPKEDMAWSRRCIGVWGVIITHIYSAKARVKSRRGVLEIQFLGA